MERQDVAGEMRAMKILSALSLIDKMNGINVIKRILSLRDLYAFNGLQSFGWFVLPSI
jgi:hypothetical protein